MPQHERGLYEPGDDARVYDASEDDEDVEGSRLPLLIVLALLVLAMFAGFVWLAYSEGVARGRGETPVITADAGPARVAPDNPGGAAEPYKGFKIYEQPAPPDDDAAPAAAPAAPAKVAAAAPASPPPATKPALTETPVQAPPAKTAPPAASAASAPAAPAKVAAATPAPKPAPPLKSSQLPPQPAAPVGPATAPPRALNTASAATPPAPKPAAPVPAASPAAAAPVPAGASVLQIGAYKSQADADRAWSTYKTKHASLLAGYSPDVKQVDLGEKGTWFRLRIAGFPSKDVASALCDRLKADGGSCFLGK
ncbi:MAG: SPOR domain-containing protein [Proteobacteria bacterium]|nr:SPOR domain-containing protein [Pseudomonadota bacterium]